MSIYTKAIALLMVGCLTIATCTVVKEFDLRGIYYTRVCDCGDYKEGYIDLNKGQKSIEENCWNCSSFDRTEFVKQD